MRKEMIVSGAIVTVAAVGVVFYALTTGPATEKKTANGHVHGAGASSEASGPVQLDPERAARIGVTYAIAETGAMTSVVRTVGSVAYDETRLVTVNPKIEGWVEALHVDFTGAPVSKGQPLLSVYSPMLVSAQEELILAKRLLDGAAAGGVAATNARELLEAARRRLRYWDISEAEIEHIEMGHTRKTFMLRAPASGLVLEKMVMRGQRIMPGMDLYKIADLSTVWLEGEVFEKDLALVRLGSTARITFESYPGQTFTGKVAYVYPTITAESRTGRVRIELPNRNLQFKPGMYATMEFTVPVHTAGIHIPRSAVLQTGERTIVFVRSDDSTLIPREITIGTATTEHIEVLAGLKQGEVIVASANFLVDAESNLGAAMGQVKAAPKAGPGPVAPKKQAPAPAADPHAGHNM